MRRAGKSLVQFSLEATEWIATLRGPFAKHHKTDAQTPLFVTGDPAPDLYFVLSGQFMVYRTLARSRPTEPRTAIRMLEYNEIVCFASGGVHTANCVATVDSSVLRIDRRWLEQQARLDPVLRRILVAARTRENEWLDRNSPTLLGKNTDLADLH